MQDMTLRKAQCPVMVRPETLERLKQIGTYSDTMDTIIAKLLDSYEKAVPA